jgi:hypothetical protein
MQQGGGQMDKQEATFTIPAAKCGIVIGRGNSSLIPLKNCVVLHKHYRPLVRCEYRIVLSSGMLTQRRLVLH